MAEPNQNNPCPEPVTCSIAVELEKLRGEVHALGEVVKASMAGTVSAFQRGEKIMDEHNDRIGKVERKVWFASGVAATLSASITAFLTKTFGGGHGG